MIWLPEIACELVITQLGPKCDGNALPAQSVLSRGTDLTSLTVLFRLDSDGNIKVGDFGLAEDVYSCGYFREENKENIRLPYKWMALESLNDNIFTEKTDVV